MRVVKMTLLLGALCVFLSIVGYSQTIPLELWFDDGQDSTTVNSGYLGLPNGFLQTGVLTGNGSTTGPVWSDDVPHEYSGNYSLHFLGNANNIWLGYGDSVGIKTFDNFTIETWMKPEESIANRQDILIVRDTIRQVLMFRLQRVSELWELESYIWDYYDSSWKVARTTGGAITLDTWQHVALTYDASSGGKYFINGVDILIFPVISDMPDFSGNWWISTPGSFAFQGYMDEFRVSDFPRIPGDGSGFGFSLAWNSSFTDYATPAPEITTPIEGISVDPSGFNLEWGAISEADFYRVIVSKTPCFRNLIFDSTNVMGNSIVLNIADTVETYYWRVGAANVFKTINWSGTESFSVTDQSSANEDMKIPDRYNLCQNHPNPFNGITVIKYTIPKESHVNIVIYDITGHEICYLVNEYQNNGNYQIKFSPDNIPSGIYLYKIIAGDYQNVKKMLYVK